MHRALSSSLSLSSGFPGESERRWCESVARWTKPSVCIQCALLFSAILIAAEHSLHLQQTAGSGSLFRRLFSPFRVDQICCRQSDLSEHCSISRSGQFRIRIFIFARRLQVALHDAYKLLTIWKDWTYLLSSMKKCGRRASGAPNPDAFRWHSPSGAEMKILPGFWVTSWQHSEFQRLNTVELCQHGYSSNRFRFLYFFRFPSSLKTVFKAQHCWLNTVRRLKRFSLTQALGGLFFSHELAALNNRL